MKAKFDLLIEECKSTAEKTAKNLEKSLKRKHPLNEVNTEDQEIPYQKHDIMLPNIVVI